MTTIPVYLFTGFLDAGKTTMIKHMLQAQELGTAEHTLLLLCEAGDEVYSKSFQETYGLQVAQIKKEEAFTCQHLMELSKTCSCTRIIVEYNGFWSMRRFHEEQPSNWLLMEKFFCADSRSILGYDANIQSIVGEKIRSSSVALFNRVAPGVSCTPYHNLVRKYSDRCQIRYELTNHHLEVDTLSDKAPYNMSAPVVQIPDHLFGYFMIDLHRSPNLYIGKTVSLNLYAAADEELAENERLLGRNTTFATAKEAAFWGVTGIFDKLPPQNEWIRITARVLPCISDSTDVRLAVEQWTSADSSLAKQLAIVY